MAKKFFIVMKVDYCLFVDTENSDLNKIAYFQHSYIYSAVWVVNF